MRLLDVALRHPWIRRVAAVAAVATLIGAASLALPVGLGGDTSFTIVAGRSMEPVLESGDLVITRRQASYAVGDVVVYEIPDGNPGAGVKVIHRIVDISADGVLRLTGDNSDHEDLWRPTHSDVLGSQWRTIPAGGAVFLWLRSPIVMAALLSAAAFRFGIRFTDAAETRRRLKGLPPAHPINGTGGAITSMEGGWAIRRHHARLVAYRAADGKATIQPL